MRKITRVDERRADVHKHMQDTRKEHPDRHGWHESSIGELRERRGRGGSLLAAHTGHMTYNQERDVNSLRDGETRSPACAITAIVLREPMQSSAVDAARRCLVSSS